MVDFFWVLVLGGYLPESWRLIDVWYSTTIFPVSPQITSPNFFSEKYWSQKKLAYGATHDDVKFSLIAAE